MFYGDTISKTQTLKKQSGVCLKNKDKLVSSTNIKRLKRHINQLKYESYLDLELSKQNVFKNVDNSGNLNTNWGFDVKEYSSFTKRQHSIAIMFFQKIYRLKYLWVK